MHRIFSHGLFSHGILMCVLCVYLQSYTWVLGSDGKSSIFLLWKLDNYSLKPVRKTNLVHFFLHYNFNHFSEFSERNSLLAISFWEVSDSMDSPRQGNNSYGTKHTLPWSLLRNCTVWPNQGDNRYGSQHSKKLTHDHFSHGMVHCVLGVSLHGSETTGIHVFVNMGNGPKWQKQYTPPAAPQAKWIVAASNLREKHLGIFFHFMTITLVKYLSYLKQAACYF